MTNPYTNEWAPVQFVHTGISGDEVKEYVKQAVLMERDFWQHKVNTLEYKLQFYMLEKYAYRDTLIQLLNENKVKATNHSVFKLLDQHRIKNGEAKNIDMRERYKDMLKKDLYTYDRDQWDHR